MAASNEKEVYGKHEAEIFLRRCAAGNAGGVRGPERIRLPITAAGAGAAAGPHVSPHGPGRAGLQ